VVDGEIYGIEPGHRLINLIDDLPAAEQRARDEPFETVPLGEAMLLAPISRPPTVRDFYAFENHVATARRSRGLEMEPDWYQLPVFYFSNPYAIVGPHAEVHMPPGTTELDFELEAAAIIGRAGSDLDPDEAEAHIAGFCIMNDWSARDLQRREMKLNLGPAKGKDSATSLGPMLVTPDELGPFRKGKAYDLTMTAMVNGREYSRGNLADIHWSFGEMIAYASRGTRVEPGDVIGSGTCGTGCILELSLVHGTEKYPWLQPGDEVTVTIDHLGALSNSVVP
jgi:2-keto-4-pentenoate hydratase/2-oxohepta-3-ene-1,7-dioic acid hydratase in catechol pathway